MKTVLLALTLLLLPLSLCAEEIDGEVNLSYVNPYERFGPGFCGSFRPEFLHWGKLSGGIGLALHITSRFRYETTDPQPITSNPNKVGWMYFDDNFMELTSFDFFAEGRWQLFGADEEAKWRGWLTLTGGAVINAAIITNYQTQYQDSLNYIWDVDEYTRAFKPAYRTDAYLAPGILIGIKNFIVGYRHWILLNEFKEELGNPGAIVGTVRVGYRFIW